MTFEDKVKLELKKRLDASGSAHCIEITMKTNGDKLTIKETEHGYEVSGGVFIHTTEHMKDINKLTTFICNYDENVYLQKMANAYEAEQHMYDYCQPSDETLMNMHG